MTTESEPHPEQIPEDIWPVDPDSPAYMVPVPARLEQPLLDQRVVLHDPSVPATRYDLFAVSEVDAHNRVGIADAATYHAAARRDRLDQLARTAARVDIDALWVERIFSGWKTIPLELHPPDVDRPSDMPDEAMLCLLYTSDAADE